MDRVFRTGAMVYQALTAGVAVFANVPLRLGKNKVARILELAMSMVHESTTANAVVTVGLFNRPLKQVAQFDVGDMDACMMAWSGDMSAIWVARSKIYTGVGANPVSQTVIDLRPGVPAINDLTLGVVCNTSDFAAAVMANVYYAQVDSSAEDWARVAKEY